MQLSKNPSPPPDPKSLSPPLNPKECDMRNFPAEQTNISDIPWLDPDGRHTIGLGDYTFHFPPDFQVTYLNLVLIVGYYPWYYPFRQYKLFGFRSWRGDDNKLYWRDYVPEPIPSPNYFWMLQYGDYPPAIGYPL